MAHAKYELPIFDLAHIVAFLRELDDRITADHIIKPTPVSVGKIYATLLDFFLGLRPEMVEGPKQTLLSRREHPELYSDAVSIMIFSWHISNLCKIAHFDSYSLQDLSRPDPTRTHHILSALVNFAKFKREAQAKIDKVTCESEAIREKRDKLDMEIRKMRDEKKAIVKQRAKDEPEVRKTKTASDALLVELSQLKKYHTALATDLNVLRKRKAELNERITHTQSFLQSAQQRGDSARSRLVQSPERQKRAISAMSDELSTEKGTEAQCERRTRDLQARVAMMDTFKQDILVCTALLDEIDVEQGKVRESAEKVAQLKDSVEYSTKDKSNLDVRRAVASPPAQLTKQLEHAAERLERTTRQAEEKRAAIVSQMKELKAEHEVISAERHVRNREMEEKKDRNARLDAQIREIQKNAEAVTAALAAAWAALEEHVEHYVDFMTRRLNVART